MLSVTRLGTTIALNLKIAEIKSKIADISNVATKSALNTKATETSAFNRLAKISLDASTKETGKTFPSKSEVANALDVKIEENREK